MEDNTDGSTFESKLIPISFFSKKNNKTTRLINNSKAEFALEGKFRWFEFEFIEGIYVKSLEIHADGYNNNWDAVTLEVTNISGSIVDARSKISDGRFLFEVCQFCSGFRFRPDAKFSLFTNQSIKNVVIIGYTADEFLKLESEIANILRDRADVQKEIASIAQRQQLATDKVAAAEARLSDLKIETAQLDKDVGQATAQLDTLNSEISQGAKRKDEISATTEDLRNQLDNIRTERRSEESDLADKKSQRAKLIEEIRLFPSEISGFVQEAKRSITIYVLLSALPMAIIIYVTYYLYSSAVDLTQIHKTGNIDVWAIFLTRMPFVVVSVTILQVCGVLIKRFINEIVEINNQRLNLSAISIVAKDVSTASASGLDISPDEKFELETKLKMSLLREQMRKYTSEKYEYRGATQGILGGPQRKQTQHSEEKVAISDEGKL